MGYKLEWIDGGTKKVMLPSGTVYTKVSNRGTDMQEADRRAQIKKEYDQEIIVPLAKVIQAYSLRKDRPFIDCKKDARSMIKTFGSHEKALEFLIKLHSDTQP